MRDDEPRSFDEAKALQLTRDLFRLRDALVNLSLVASDYVFEANRAQDDLVFLKAQSVIEKVKSQKSSPL